MHIYLLHISGFRNSTRNIFCRPKKNLIQKRDIVTPHFLLCRIVELQQAISSSFCLNSITFTHAAQLQLDNFRSFSLRFFVCWWNFVHVWNWMCLSVCLCVYVVGRERFVCEVYVKIYIHLQREYYCVCVCLVKRNKHSYKIWMNGKIVWNSPPHIELTGAHLRHGEAQINYADGRLFSEHTNLGLRKLVSAHWFGALATMLSTIRNTHSRNPW